MFYGFFLYLHEFPATQQRFHPVMFNVLVSFGSITLSHRGYDDFPMRF